MIHYIAGPPCAGKTTHANTHAQPTDIILDLDPLAHTLGYPTPHINWTTPTHLDHPARRLALIARTSILKHHQPTDTIWLIDTNSTHPHTLVLDPGPTECHRRATTDQRPTHTHQQIDTWYHEHPHHP